MSATARTDGLIHAGHVDAFVLNRFRIVDTPAGSVGVVRAEDGFHAVLNRCPHMGAPVCIGTDLTNSTAPSRPFEYKVGHEMRVVRCPWHRWEFRVDTGESIGNTNKGRLLRFPVILEGEEVYVQPRPIRATQPARSGIANQGIANMEPAAS